MAATDALPIPRKFTAFRVTFPIHDANGDPVTGAASLDSEVSIDGAAFVDAANETVEIGNGIYYLDLDTGDMQGDTVAVAVKSDQKTTNIIIFPEEAGDIRVDVQQVDGDTGAADSIQKLYADTGVVVTATIRAIRGDTGAAANLQANFATTPSYFQQVDVQQIDGDTGDADRLGKFASNLSPLGQIDTGGLAGTQAGTIDSNITYVNETRVQGTGDTGTGDTWRPV